VPNAIARQEVQHEIETKLILSSDFKGWNISENFIAEKSLAHAPWEFGYAWGVNRPIRLAASPLDCNLCRENWRAGVEIYGETGTLDRFTLHGTSQYLARIVSWELPNGTTFRISPTFGLTDQAYRFMLRVGVSYEYPALGRRVKQFFQGGSQ